MDIKINFDYGNKYYVACSNNNGFNIVGFYTLKIAKVIYEQKKQFYTESKIGEIKGQVTIENLIFDYFTKFRGKV